jgi:trehalose 6-phosphate synthase
VGFLAERWASAFLDCCEAVLGARVMRGAAGVGRVNHRGRITDVAVHPLGVDAKALRERAAAADVRAAAATLAGLTADGRQLIVRVDRTELSKNVARGLAAYRELLATRPQWRGRVTHLALSYPSRSGLPEYQAYTARVHELAKEINAEFETPGWTPLVLEVRDDYPRSLAACGAADVLLVNPIRDGMNLVAEEGPILSERGCALVLSREAGAAALIGDAALIVNPYDVTATAQALHEGLSMTATERRRRSAEISALAAARAPRQWLAEQVESLG